MEKCDIDGDNTTDVEAEEPCTRTIDAGDGQLIGLPVVGFAVQKYMNGETLGTELLANYAISVRIKDIDQALARLPTIVRPIAPNIVLGALGSFFIWPKRRL